MPQNETFSKKSVILVDMKPKPMQPCGDRTTRVEIDLYVFNAAMMPVSKLIGRGSFAVPIASMEGGIQIDQALAQLDAKMAQYVR